MRSNVALPATTTGTTYLPFHALPLKFQRAVMKHLHHHQHLSDLRSGDGSRVDVRPMVRPVYCTARSDSFATRPDRPIHAMYTAGPLRVPSPRVWYTMTE